MALKGERAFGPDDPIAAAVNGAARGADGKKENDHGSLRGASGSCERSAAEPKEA